MAGASALIDPAVDTVDQAVRRMQAIEKALAPGDGLAWFNTAYLQVTLDVRKALAAKEFEDCRFMEALDVAFANLYFDALRAATNDPTAVPHCWRPVMVEKRYDSGPTGAQFVFSGLNAHLMHDLPISIVDTCQQLDTAPGQQPHHADYLAINAIVAKADDQVRQELKNQAAPKVHLHASLLENWAIDRARDAAWTLTEALWAVRADHRLASACREAYDHGAALVSRLLLVHLP